MGDVFLGLRLRSSDILIAIMGMAGPGKSTLILLCTGQDVPVGHDLQAYTSDIYLLDTPGFDDTNRSDTEVLKEIALCLTKTYEDNIKLSGILYLHRITDRRMGGSAKKNLMMFRKLCGEESLMNVILVTTMWEDEYAAIGERREQELIATGGSWGALVEEGAQINRHNNTRSSAMPLLRTIAKSDRVTISIQKEMVSEHKDLNKTEAGIGLNSDILLAELRVMKEMSEALEMERQARKDQDERSAEEQRQYRETMQKRFDHLNQERENLKVGLEEMKEQIRRFKVLEGKYRENQERMRQQDKIESLEEQHKLREQEMLQRTEEASRELKSLRLQLSERGNARMGISSMRPRSSGSHYVTGSKDLVLFLSGRGFFLEAEAEISKFVRLVPMDHGSTTIILEVTLTAGHVGRAHLQLSIPNSLLG
uniref:G domain-containing protein n=1 Tax=Fusarium oxysporum (strain Fo5176) TaxID=660025 RepID=A0A0D2Y0J9_FUSOF